MYIIRKHFHHSMRNSKARTGKNWIQIEMLCSKSKTQNINWKANSVLKNIFKRPMLNSLLNIIFPLKSKKGIVSEEMSFWKFTPKWLCNSPWLLNKRYSNRTQKFHFFPYLPPCGGTEKGSKVKGKKSQALKILREKNSSKNTKTYQHVKSF